MDELKHGDRVKVKGTLLYNGRVGTLKPISDDPEDPWDFYVDLDASEDPKPDSINREARTVGVMDFQVEHLEEPVEERN